MQVTIIGAGAGISKSVAKLFGSKGYAIALISRSEDKLKTEVAELKNMGIDAIYEVADAGVEGSLNSALDNIRDRIGHADMILYNAYSPVFKSIENETWESIRKQLDVNVGGAFFLLKKTIPYFKKENKGKLFFTGGGLAIYPQPSLTGLSMGKAALRNLILGTAEDFKGTNVHIATVTITGFVKDEDPKYNPQAIAEQYWGLFNQTVGEFETEVIY